MDPILVRLCIVLVVVLIAAIAVHVAPMDATGKKIAHGVLAVVAVIGLVWAAIGERLLGS